MAELSPAAWAVAAAASVARDHARSPIAAALRVAADQIGPEETLPAGYIYSAPAEEWHYQFKLRAKNKLLAIATELENQ